MLTDHEVRHLFSGRVTVKAKRWNSHVEAEDGAVEPTRDDRLAGAHFPGGDYIFQFGG